MPRAAITRIPEALMVAKLAIASPNEAKMAIVRRWLGRRNSPMAAVTTPMAKSSTMAVMPI